MADLYAFIRMFRLPNLAIVFLSQWLPYWWILRPALLKAGVIPVLGEKSFCLMAAATVLTTLAGYIINDVFDYRIDLINKPGRVVVDRLAPAWLMVFFYLFLLGGVAALVYRFNLSLPVVAGRPGDWTYWLYPAVCVLLFLYAWQLKCTPFLGNFTVALLCAVVPVLTLLPEARPLHLISWSRPDAAHQSLQLMWLYALFAFTTTLLREQIKDIEDFPGDSACGCHTLPVAKSVRFARIPAFFTAVLLCILLVLTLLYLYYAARTNLQIALSVILLALPALAVTVLLYTATEQRHYRRVSTLVKLIMLFGIVLLGIG